jgi:hypothetical protein
LKAQRKLFEEFMDGVDTMREQRTSIDFLITGSGS